MSKSWSEGIKSSACLCSDFSAAPIDLAGARLVALDPQACASLAEAIVAMPPWSMVNYPAEAMARFLASSDGGGSLYGVEVDGAEAGAVSIRSPRARRCRARWAWLPDRQAPSGTVSTKMTPPSIETSQPSFISY